MRTRTYVTLLIMGLFMVGMIGGVSPAHAISNNLASQAELSVPLTAMNVYNSYYKPEDYLANSTHINVSPIDEFTLLKTKSELDLEYLTVESDDILLTEDISLYDRSYSKTFFNDTFESGTESNATATTVNTEFTISSRGTSATANVTNDAVGATNNVYWRSYMGFDSNGDGDYSDAEDKAYLPLGGYEWFYIGVETDFSSSPNAGTYGQISLVFERSSGTDYTVSIRMYEGSGDTGWSGVGSTADDSAVFKAYDSDDAFIGISIPIGTMFAEDSSETGTIVGLDYPEAKIVLAGASDSVQLTVKNLAVFNNQPALTDRTDDDDDFDDRNSAGIAAGVHDSDSDYLFTKITEGATESYDSKIALNNDLNGWIPTLVSIRYARFDGYASIQPSTGTSTSVAVSGTNYYLTTETISFDTRDIDALTTFSNIYSWGNVQFNITIDDSVFPFTTNYEENLVSFTVNQLDKYNTFKSAWEADGVSGSTSPKSEVQYDLTDPDTTTGQVDEFTVGFYTDDSYSISQVETSSAASPGVATTTSAAAGGAAVVTSSGMSTQDMVIVILLVVIGSGVGALALSKRNTKPSRRRK